MNTATSTVSGKSNFKRRQVTESLSHQEFFNFTKQAQYKHYRLQITTISKLTTQNNKIKTTNSTKLTAISLLNKNRTNQLPNN